MCQQCAHIPLALVRRTMSQHIPFGSPILPCSKSTESSGFVAPFGCCSLYTQPPTPFCQFCCVILPKYSRIPVAGWIYLT